MEFHLVRPFVNYFLPNLSCRYGMPLVIYILGIYIFIYLANIFIEIHIYSYSNAMNIRKKKLSFATKFYN